jgi:hypothetical protein
MTGASLESTRPLRRGGPPERLGDETGGDRRLSLDRPGLTTEFASKAPKQ